MIDYISDYIFSQLKNNQFLSGGLIITIIGALGYYLKPAAINVWGSLKRIVEYSLYFDEKDMFFRNFNKWLNQSEYNKKIRNVQLTTRAVDKKRVLILNQRDDQFFIWFKNRPIFIVKNQEKLENARDMDALMYNSYTIKGIFAKEQIEQLMKMVLAYCQVDRPKDGFELYVSGENSWSYSGEVIGRSYESVIIDNIIKINLLKKINEFLTSSEWYYDKGIPYRMSFMFEGPPGTGKTSLVKAIASETGMSLHYLNLSGEKMDDNALMRMFFSLYTKSIILIEDVDALFDGRKSLTNNGVTFSGFINCIDGVASKHGIIIIYTTNKAANLDEALTRSGRIDQVIKFDYPKAQSLNEYFKMFFDQDLGLTDNDVKKNVSMAKIQDICLNNRHKYTAAAYEILKVVNEGHELPTRAIKLFPTASGNDDIVDPESEFEEEIKKSA